LDEARRKRVRERNPKYKPRTGVTYKRLLDKIVKRDIRLAKEKAAAVARAKAKKPRRESSRHKQEQSKRKLKG
jgi:hypothetical protein